MSAALARYANAGQPIGHAGPTAPIHADERIALADLPNLAAPTRLERRLSRIADLPGFADTLPRLEGLRAKLLQGEVVSLRKQHRILLDAMREISLSNDDAARIARAAMLRASFE